MPEQAADAVAQPSPDPAPQGQETARYEQLELPLFKPLFDDTGTGGEYPEES